ncbi:hypothetical protein PO124_14350 [Bacillus licheniformis]|nr:hypothetical protein [Bacillus licheniformis]
MLMLSACAPNLGRRRAGDGAETDKSKEKPSFRNTTSPILIINGSSFQGGESPRLDDRTPEYAAGYR